MNADTALRALKHLGVAEPERLRVKPAPHETDIEVLEAEIDDEERLEIWLGHPESTRASVAHVGAAASMLEVAGVRAPAAFRMFDIDGVRGAVRSPRGGKAQQSSAPGIYHALGRHLAGLPTFDHAGIDVESGGFRPLSYSAMLGDLVDRAEASLTSSGLQRHPAFDSLCQAFRDQSAQVTSPPGYRLVLPDLQPGNLFVEDGQLVEVGGLSASLLAAPAFQWGAALHLPRDCSLALLSGAGIDTLRDMKADLAVGFLGRAVHQCSVWAALARRASPWERANVAHLIAALCADTLTHAPAFLGLDSDRFVVASTHWFHIAELASSLPRPGRREIERVALAVALLELDAPEEAKQVLQAIGPRFPATPPKNPTPGELLTAHLARRAAAELGTGFEPVVDAIAGWNTHRPAPDTPVEHLGELALRAWGEHLGADELGALSEHWDAASWRAPDPVEMSEAIGRAVRRSDALALPRLLGLRSLDADRLDIPGIAAALLTL